MEYDVTDVERSFKSDDASLLEWAVLRMFFDSAVKAELDEIEIDEKDGPRELAVLRRHMDSKHFCKIADDDTTVTARSDKEIEDKLAKLRKGAHLLGDEHKPRLSQLGLWNALSEVVSPGALARIRDNGTFYHLIAENPSALEWGIFWLRQASVMGELFQFSRETAPDGVETITRMLVDRIEQCDRVHLRCDHEVVRVEHGKRPDEVVVRVRCRDATRDPHCFSQRADHVILALPQWPLQQLDEHFPAKVRKRLTHVLPLKLLKAFLVTRNPWWKSHLRAQTFAWMVPTRELHFFRPGERACRKRLNAERNCNCEERLSKAELDYGMIMLYTDEPAIAYWRALMPGDEHRQAVWELYDGGSATDAVKDDPYGLLATLIRRLIMTPHLSLAHDINASKEDSMEALKKRDPSLAGRVETIPGSKLGFAEQLHSATKGSKEDALGVYEVLKGHGFEVDEDWWDLIGRALDDVDSAGSADRHAPEICAYGIRDWSAAPYGGAAHVWHPGARARRALRDPLIAFRLRGREDDRHLANVHICGEAYSGFQGFIEGALRTAEAVVEAIVPERGAIDSLFSSDAELRAKESEWIRRQGPRLSSRWRELQRRRS